MNDAESRARWRALIDGLPGTARARQIRGERPRPKAKPARIPKAIADERRKRAERDVLNAAALPAHCRRCDARVFLATVPFRWCDRDGTPHRCARAS